LIWHVVVADVFWLCCAMILLDLAKMGTFGWKRRESMVWWLKALCCYVVVELFLHKQMEWLASIVMSMISRWED
jgi:hypothetical protein